MKNNVFSLIAFVIAISCYQQGYAQPANPVVPPAETAPALVPPNTDFVKALESAYNTNPALKSAREQLKLTDERMSIAVSGLRPTVNMN